MLAAHLRVGGIGQRLPPDAGEYAFGGHQAHLGARLLCGTAQVRAKNYIFQGQERINDRYGLDLEHIQARSGDQTVPQIQAETVEDSTPAEDDDAYAGPVGGLSPDVADDPDHQNAWRIARVLAADLEGYHEDDVREGVLYGTFYSVLREPIEKARKTYEQRVAKEIVEGYDYFSKALDELIVRKRMELEEEGAF